MCVCALWVQALLISFSVVLGRVVAEVGPRTSLNGLGSIFCRNQGSLPSGIGSTAFLGVGNRPGDPSCVMRKTGLCVSQRSLKFKAGNVLVGESVQAGLFGEVCKLEWRVCRQRALVCELGFGIFEKS